MDNEHFQYLLRLGDDSLILGQRVSEWTGHAPSIEVDLSLANIALDLIGQATHFLNHAGTLEGAGRDGDRLAFHRDGFDFTNSLLVEQPNGDFARTMARQLIFSTWQLLLFERLTNSTDPVLAAIAAKAIKETAYHAELASEWVIRLGDGTEESHRRMTDGLEWTWRFVGELFATDDVDSAMIAKGVGADPAEFRADYDARIASVLKQATLDAPPEKRLLDGGRRGQHGEHLGHSLSEMQFLPRAYPTAKW
jgi:ring-1,2-phenylacetyl-CoA epoxidase subunit PaaC